jgi:hypothetical protein
MEAVKKGAGQSGQISWDVQGESGEGGCTIERFLGCFKNENVIVFSSG